MFDFSTACSAARYRPECVCVCVFGANEAFWAGQALVVCGFILIKAPSLLTVSTQALAH